MMKKVSIVIAIAMIFAIIAIPALAGVNALSSTAGWGASDLPNNLVAWATLSFSGGNGSNVICSAYATTNLGNMSTISKVTDAVSASYIGNKVAYKLETPFVVSYGGNVVYQ